MDSLIIQDTFEPYYCDRKPFTVSEPRKRWVKVSSSKGDASQSGPSQEPAAPVDGDTAAEG